MADWFDENAPPEEPDQKDWFEQNAPPQEPPATAQQYAQQVSAEPTREQEIAVAEQHPIMGAAAQALGETVSGFVPHSVGQAAELVGQPVVGAVEQIGKAGMSLRDVLFGGQTPSQAAETNFPESFALREAEKTPPFSKERFAAGFGTIANMGMAAAIGRGLPLRDVLFGRENPTATAATEAVVEPTIERTGEPNAVEPSTTQVETGGTAQRIETGAEGNVPATGRGDNVVGEAQGATEQGQVPGTEARQGTEAQPQTQEVAPTTTAPTVPDFAAKYDPETLLVPPRWAFDKYGKAFEDKIFQAIHNPEKGFDITPVWKIMTPAERQELISRGFSPLDTRTPRQVILQASKNAIPARNYFRMQEARQTSTVSEPTEATTAQPLPKTEEIIPEIKRYDIPPDAIVQIRGRKVGGGEGIVELDARTAEGRLTKERSSYQTLLDCLGR